MKLKKLLMLAVVAILAVMALVSCDGNPDDSTSKKPDESSSTGPQTVTVTFNWGVKVWGEDKEDEDKPDEYKYSQSFTFEKGDDVKVPQEVKDTLNDVEGYFTSTWDIPIRDLRDIQEDTVLNALYTELELYTYTFKNMNGEVIKTDTAWEGSSIVDEAPDTATPVFYFENKTGMKDPVAYVVGETTYWIEAADEARLDKAVAVPVGYVFVGWTPSKPGNTTSVLKDNNVVFTANLGNADETIMMVEKGTITKDNMLDKALYTKLDAKLYKKFISNKINSNDAKLDCSIIDQYENLAAANAVSAEEGQKYAEALAKWNLYTNGIEASFYMAWDGEFIYFLAEITDPTVVTNGSAYTAVENPYEQDGVELWYSINNNKHKVSMDAMGIRLFSTAGNNPSAYLNYMAQQGYAKAKVTDKNGATVDMSDKATSRIIEGATGYTVAFAFPAFDEPADPSADLNNKENWGTPLQRGATFYASLQINNVSAAASTEAINASIAAGGTAINANSTAEQNQAIARIAIGSQSASNGGKGVLRIALG